MPLRYFRGPSMTLKTDWPEGTNAPAGYVDTNQLRNFMGGARSMVIVPAPSTPSTNSTEIRQVRRP